MPLTSLVFLCHCLAAFFMTGVIWFVQVVHYPLFGQVGLGNFVRYEEQHALLTTFVVLPPMFLELITSACLLGARPRFVSTTEALLIFGLTGLVWLLTFVVHVPQHDMLGRGFSAELHAALVTTNWGRTILWTAKSGLVAWLLVRAMQPGDEAIPIRYANQVPQGF